MAPLLEYWPRFGELLEPESISSFSKMKTKATGYRASCQFDLSKGFSSALRYQHANFEDALGNPYDDAEDGKAHILLLTLGKRW